MKRQSIIFLIFFLAACGDTGTGYLYYDNTPVQEKDERLYPLTLLKADKKIDVLLVVDNSGSMFPIHENVMTNASLFFEQFSLKKYVDWKLGIISTDRRQKPFLGFKSDFDAKLIHNSASFQMTVKTFREAVAELGTKGDTQELVFYNIERNFGILRWRVRHLFFPAQEGPSGCHYD